MKYLKLFEEFRSNDKLDVLKKHLDRTNIDLAKWIIKNLGINVRSIGPLTDKAAESIILSVNKKEYWPKLPTMYFFDSPAEDVPEETWLVHYTKFPEEIARTGFNKGEPDYLKLGMSWGKNSNQPGYNYGFVPEDAIEKYGSLQEGYTHWSIYSHDRGGAVFFKAPAIKVYHFGDEIEQAIFWGPDAYEIIPVTRKDGKWNYKENSYETLDDVYKILDENSKDINESFSSNTSLIDEKYVDLIMDDEYSKDSFMYQYLQEESIIEEEFDESDFKKWLIYELEYRAEAFMDSIQKMFVNGKLKVWRSMRVKDDWVTNLDRQNSLGIYWSWEKESAEPHWGYGVAPVEVLIEAEVFQNAIDWVSTVRMNINPSYEEEKEIRLKKGSSLSLKEITVNSEKIDLGRGKKFVA